MRAGRPTKQKNPKAWAENFVKRCRETMLYETEELVAELDKYIKQEYTRGYQSAKRPPKQPCTWCGKGVELPETIHQACKDTKENL